MKRKEGSYSYSKKVTLTVTLLQVTNYFSTLILSYLLMHI